VNKKPTEREQRIEKAQDLFYNCPESHAAQAEACMYLKTRLRLSRQDIALVLGLSFRTVMTRLHRYKFYVAEGQIPSKELSLSYGDSPLTEVMDEEAERLEKNALNREATQTIRREIFEERLSDAIAPLLAQAEANVPAIEKLHRDYLKHKCNKTPKTAAQEVVAVMSDLHLELNTHGHPQSKSYEAVDTFVEKVLRLTDLHRQTNRVDTLHLLALGDLIQGTANYPNQRWDVLVPAIDQAENMTELLVKILERLSVHFERIIVWWGNGNHEYLNPKKQNTDPDQASWGTVIARALKWAFRGNKRIEFNIPETWYSVANIMGSRFLLTHGHAVKGAGSIDGLIAQCRKWADVLPAHDYVVMGHFHRLATAPLPRAFGSTKHRYLFMNGTAVESDEFLEQFGSSPVSQWWVFFVNEKRGITAEYKVDLYD
jgi:predicted phosphodiesterase